MKAPNTFFMAALVWGTFSLTHGQEAESSKPAVPPASTITTGATTTASAPGGATNSELASIFSPGTLQSLGVGPNARVVSVMTNRLDVLEGRRARLEGGLVPLIQRPTLVTFLQLFNPFAPAEYGGMVEGQPGSAFSRAFADPIKTYPTAALFSVGARPE